MKQGDLAKLLGVSERTIARAKKRITNKKWKDLDESELILIASEVRKRGFLEYDNQTKWQVEPDKMTGKTGQNVRFDEVVLLLEKILTILQTLLEKTTLLLEKTMFLEKGIKNYPRLPYNENVVKDIIQAIKEYMVKNDIYDMTLNDVFLELLGKYEKDLNKNIRKNYLKEDRNYYHTIVRMGLVDDFIAYIRGKI